MDKEQANFEADMAIQNWLNNVDEELLTNLEFDEELIPDDIFDTIFSLLDGESTAESPPDNPAVIHASLDKKDGIHSNSVATDTNDLSIDMGSILNNSIGQNTSSIDRNAPAAARLPFPDLGASVEAYLAILTDDTGDLHGHGSASIEVQNSIIDREIFRPIPGSPPRAIPFIQPTTNDRNGQWKSEKQRLVDQELFCKTPVPSSHIVPFFRPPINGCRTPPPQFNSETQRINNEAKTLPPRRTAFQRLVGKVGPDSEIRLSSSWTRAEKETTYEEHHALRTKVSAPARYMSDSWDTKRVPKRKFSKDRERSASRETVIIVDQDLTKKPEKPEKDQQPQAAKKRKRRTSSTGRQYNCSVCGKAYGTSSGKNFHEESVHQGVRYRCQICKTIMKTSRCMVGHVTNTHPHVVGQLNKYIIRFTEY